MGRRRRARGPLSRGGIVGTGIGGIETLLKQHLVMLEKGPGRVSPFMVPALMANAAAGHLAMKYGFTGPNYCTVSACASSNHAIGEGMRLIRDGYLDVAIVGGTEAATHPLTVAAFAQMTALTKNPDPETASRPFDAQRNGFVLSEGAAAMILETEEHARARGARATARSPATGCPMTRTTSPRRIPRDPARPSRCGGRWRTPASRRRSST